MIFSLNVVCFAAGSAISGSVDLGFGFDGNEQDGAAVLYQKGTAVKTVPISENGSYNITDIASGDYDLVVSIAGYTDYTMKEISVSSSDSVAVFETSVTPGDVDKNGIVDVADVSNVLLSDNYGRLKTDAVSYGADVNHDSTVDINDISIVMLSDNYGKKAVVDYYVNNGWTGYY